MGYEKGVYPSDDYLISSINKKEMYIMEYDNEITASVILNSSFND